MVDFAYTTVPGKIKTLFAKIREVGIPPKATQQWLRAVGFKSSNDMGLLGVLRFVGFIDPTGVPTPTWTQYRGANHKKVMGDAIRKGYAELFAVYPDAWQRNSSDLEHVFSTSSSGGRQVIAKTVSTFKSLTELAEFTPVNGETDLHMSSAPLHLPVTAREVRDKPSAIAPQAREPHRQPSVHIDVQIHISPQASSDQIDQIFASMAKHLYGEKNE